MAAEAALDAARERLATPVGPQEEHAAIEAAQVAGAPGPLYLRADWELLLPILEGVAACPQDAVFPLRTESARALLAHASAFLAPRLWPSPLQELLNELFDRISLREPEEAEAQARAILTGLGFSREQQDAPLGQLSGERWQIQDSWGNGWKGDAG